MSFDGIETGIRFIFIMLILGWLLFGLSCSASCLQSYGVKIQSPFVIQKNAEGSR